MNAEKVKHAGSLSLKDASQDPYFFRPEKSSVQTKKLPKTNVFEKSKFLIKSQQRIAHQGDKSSDFGANTNSERSRTKLLLRNLNENNRKQMRIEDFIKRSSHNEANSSHENLSAEIESVNLSSSDCGSSVFSIGEVDFDERSTTKVLTDLSNRKLDKIKQFVKMNEEIKRKELVKISSLDEFLSEYLEPSNEESPSGHKKPGKVHRNKSMEDIVSSDSSISILDDDVDDKENSSVKFESNFRMESELAKIRFVFMLKLGCFRLNEASSFISSSQLKELTESQIEYLINKNSSYFVDIFTGNNVTISNMFV